MKVGQVIKDQNGNKFEIREILKDQSKIVLYSLTGGHLLEADFERLPKDYIDGIEGTEEILIKITCPFCHLTESYCPSSGEQSTQFESFEPSEDGLIHYYKCEKCGKYFFTKLD